MAKAVYGEERDALFASFRNTEAKTTRGKLRALLRLFQKVGWAKNVLARNHGDTKFCLEGGLIALGLAESPFEPRSNVARGVDPQVRDRILRAAEEMGYRTVEMGYRTVHLHRLNDSLGSKKTILKILERAIKDTPHGS